MVIPCDMKTVPQKTVPEEKIAMSTTPNYQWVEVNRLAAFCTARRCRGSRFRRKNVAVGWLESEGHDTLSENVQ